MEEKRATMRKPIRYNFDDGQLLYTTRVRAEQIRGDIELPDGARYAEWLFAKLLQAWRKTAKHSLLLSLRSITVVNFASASLLSCTALWQSRRLNKGLA